jgi:nitroimidazol reductase NimA-like FMN-containing flavoprotein (pyridoxamine 5'-phosphate oxidase superfamily)
MTMTAKPPELPNFRELDESESRAVLARHHVGRLAFTLHDRVDVEPISYVLSGEWLYCRTSPGTKLVTIAHNPWIAFEVDEIEGPFDWRSVVVRGTAYFLTPGIRGDHSYDEAVEHLRSIDQRALTHEDLAPHRTMLFRIHVNDIVGRAASTHE